ncbi:MAG: hypothetical protein DMF29_07015 [Verrucomicrobia bacterium]|nr:MAG: hypothetical protein DMF29_07015 [Verrucomicrobiota bacterium]
MWIRSVCGVNRDSKRIWAKYVSDLERGTRNPSVGSIQKIAHALQVPVAKLFEVARGGPRSR